GSFSALPAIPPATILAGTILYARWRETGTTQWHPWPMSVPAYTKVDVLWRIRNNSNGRATFAVSTGTPERFFTIHSDTVATLDPGGEADLVHEGYRGEKAGTSGTQTWDLIALAGEVTSSYVLDWLEAVFVDSVTLHYSWY
ncbi:unnamed protein product, partial [marine sediment metagenome]